MQLIGQRAHPGGHLPRPVAHQNDRGDRFGCTIDPSLAVGPGRLGTQLKGQPLAGIALLGIDRSPAHRIPLTPAADPISCRVRRRVGQVVEKKNADGET